VNELAAAALSLMFGATVPCNAPPGTVVARMLMSGGDGNPIGYTISGDTADFRIRGSVIVVGLAGLDPTHCNSTRSVTVKATQP
jgi:hypothetical protein